MLRKFNFTLAASVGMTVNLLLLTHLFSAQPGTENQKGSPPQSNAAASQNQTTPPSRQGPSLQEQQIQNELYYEQNAFRDAIDRQRAMQRSLEDYPYPYSDAGPSYYESPLESGERQ